MTVAEQNFYEKTVLYLKKISESLEIIADEMKMRNELLSKDVSKEKH